VGGEGFSIAKQLGIQLFAGLLTAVYAAIATYIILKLVQAMVGLRVDEQEENTGLDTTYHGEEAYND